MDDSLFYVTALLIPIVFVILGSCIRYIIKRKKEWELFYFGIELTLAGLAAAFLHLMSPPPEQHTEMRPTAPHPASSLLTGRLNTDIMIALSSPSHWSYAGRCGWAIFVLFFALIMIVGLHCLFEDPPKNFVKFHSVLKVVCLFVLADLLGGGMMVYMERLLR